MYNIVRVTVSAIGIQAFIEDQWMRLHVPKVLRIFFVTRVSYQLTVYVSAIYYDTPPKMHFENITEEYKHENLTLILQNLLVRSCETFVSLLGTTSFVSFIAHYIGLLMAFCVGSDTEEDRNMGTVSAILFFLLALQTGLTGLEPVKRLVRLYRNFALLSAAILHFIHSMVNPILLSLSASHSTSVKKHLRVLAMCAVLVIYPICLVTYLWQHHSASPWLLAVTAFSIEVIIKVIVSLMVYSLFMIDSYRDTFWEKLDDYIYYIQSTGNTIEFLFGIFMFCNGGWIMIFESGGAIRAVMMCVHAYLNIFVQAKEGWKVFIKRRTAVNKINSLREATKEELEAFNDVCAICYQELKTARVTRCNHYYHSVCLRKWLYVQDNCPLCHEVLYKPPGDQNGEANTQTMDEANQNNIHNDNREPPDM
jgi:E3 ubiquitin-protein ligase RNF139